MPRPARYPQPEPDFFFTPDREHRKPDHFTDFLNCVRTRGKTQCNEDEAFIEAATLLMSFESYRQKRMVRWDALREKIVQSIQIIENQRFDSETSGYFAEPDIF